MKLLEIPLERLFVNERNDRHDDVDSENDAVAWLLFEFGKRMQNLGIDIVDTQRVFEPPLVKLENGRYRVFDGNRRVTALKLLKGQVSAPQEFSEFWRKLSLRVDENDFNSVLCQIEDDEDTINEILFRRHNGSNHGVGQNDWDDEARQNFLRRTGKQKKIKVSDAIVAHLKETDQLPTGYKIRRSKVDRLFSAKKFQRPFGFEFDDGKLVFLMDEDTAIKRVMTAVAKLSRSEFTLADIWDEKRKTDFIDACGYVEPATAREPKLNLFPGLSEASAAAPKQNTKEQLKHRTYAPRLRDRVIPQGCFERVNWSGIESRTKQVWCELEYKLTLSSHPNSCAVMLRVLLDLLTLEYHEKVMKIAGAERASFKKALVAVTRDLAKRNKLAEDTANSLVIAINRDDFFSAHALNGWVHDPIMFPATEHIRQAWNSMEPLAISAMSSIEERRT